MTARQRLELREAYMQGWYQMDAKMLVAACAPEFIFDDPAEPEPVTREMLPAYMQRWDERTRALGGNNRWRLTHEVREDRDGVMTHWEWWELFGTPLQGAAVVLTGDNGVILERITYFDQRLSGQ